MPIRHSPPLVADLDAAEKMKRPKTTEPRKRRTEKPQIVSKKETNSLTPPAPASPPQSSNLTEPINSPAPANPLQPQASTRPYTPDDSIPTKAKEGVISIAGIEFHHESEAEFARLLNYYGIEWQYEPNQFPLQWREGRPTVMFAPDFYLTEYDLYIELTTMRQSLVRRKNRKLRLLRALYPEINIKLIYRRDYQRLLERFGIPTEELEAEQPQPNDN